MTTAVDKWPACARLVAGRYGRPLTHSSYTTSRGTTRFSVLGCLRDSFSGSRAVCVAAVAA